MLNTVKISSCELINADCLEFIRSLPENSVDLIVTDPPYFKVKPEGWDNQWKGDDDYCPETGRPVELALRGMRVLVPSSLATAMIQHGTAEYA